MLEALVTAIPRFPPRGLRRIARAAARLVWTVDRPRRRLALRNLEIAFGDGGPPRSRWPSIARESLARLFENALLAAWAAGRGREKIQPLVEVGGALENLLPAAARGRGVVAVMSHLGNWEIAARIAALIPELEFATVYQPLRSRTLDRLVARWRAADGVLLINRHRGLAEASACLRRGGVVAVFADQHAGDGGLWAPLFGRLASTTPLPAILARRTGAAILPVLCRNLPDGEDGLPRWRVEFGAPLPAAGKSDGEITVGIHARLELEIRRDPPAWLWIHDRWKTPSPNLLLRRYRRGVYAPPGARLKPFRLLVRGVNWLGDSMLTIPALRAIHAGRPDLHLTLLAPPALGDLWRGQPFVDEVITSLDEARGRRYDAAILLPNSFRSAWEAWRLGIPRRQGYAGHGRRCLLTAVCPESFRAGAGRHDALDFLGLARWSGASAEGGMADYRLQIADFPGGPGLQPSAFSLQPSYCVLHPGAAFGSAKRWLPERFVETARRFPDLRWVLAGAGPERARNARMASQIGANAEDWTGRLTLPQLARVLSGARAVLCNDSGPMHLAAAVGARVVAVFGSTDPSLTGPLGPGHRVLCHPADCAPCFRRECPADLRCMRSVTADEAEAALREILSGKI